MMMQLREQAERFGLEVQDRNVESVDLSSKPYKVMLEGEEYFTHSIIISTGAESIGWMLKVKQNKKQRYLNLCYL